MNSLVNGFCPQDRYEPEEANNDPTKSESREGDANESEDEAEEVLTGKNAEIVTPSPKLTKLWILMMLVHEPLMRHQFSNTMHRYKMMMTT